MVYHIEKSKYNKNHILVKAQFNIDYVPGDECDKCLLGLAKFLIGE